jgi:hypothetical protein
MKPFGLSILAMTLLACSDNFEKDGSEITAEPAGEASTEPSGEPGSEVDPLTTDDDGDGFTENQGDCDDSNSQINPGAQDRAVDGFDQNCDGIDGPDLDQDGYVDLAAGGNDCNDNNPNVNPGMEEDFTDGLDTDCDGVSDPGFYAVVEEYVDELCDGECDRVAISVDGYRQAHVVYEYEDEIWYNYRMTNGSWAGFESAATPTNDVVVACTDSCGTDNVWVNDGWCDDGGGPSTINPSMPTSSVCSYGTDCSDCGERYSDGGARRLGVAGMDAKVDGQNRVQVAFTEEGSNFTALQYIFRDAQGNWSEPLEIDGPGTNDRYNVGRDVAMDIDSANMPTFVYYNGESGVPYIYDMTNPLVSGLTGLNGINLQLDIGIPEINVADLDPTGGTLANLLPYDVLGGYSGLYNTVVIDANDDAHAIFYNHNEIQQVLNDLRNNGWVGWAVPQITSLINSYVGFDVVSSDPGTINQYSSLSLTDIWGTATGGGSYCYNNVVSLNQGIYNSAAIMNNGNLCVAYFDNDNQQVKYGCNTGTCNGWNIETVVNANVGSPVIPADNWEELGNRDLIPKDRVRLAFNNKDAPYIVYHNATNNSVNVALKENGSWETYYVGPGGEQLDVDIDPTNFIHIAYIDSMGNVKYVMGQ